jgi:hypothetical protein
MFLASAASNTVRSVGKLASSNNLLITATIWSGHCTVLPSSRGSWRNRAVTPRRTNNHRTKNAGRHRSV